MTHDELRIPVAAADVDYARLFRLDGDFIAVVGAGAGIGEHIARATAALGARILCVDVDEEPVRRVATELDAPYIVADATTPSGVDTIARVVESNFDRLNGYVDVIGRIQRKPLPEFTLEEWDEDFRINLRHAFLLGQRIAPLVARSKRGSIVHVSSVMGRHAGKMSPGYGPAKAALDVWVQSMAAQYGSSGVRVNAVAPGLFISPRFVEKSLDSFDFFAARTMLGRLGQPFEVAGLVVFLLTRAAGYITASSILVDGGASRLDSTGLDALRRDT